jgi:hypothetical protein
MDIQRLLRIADGLITVALLVMCFTGTVIAWASGQLWQVNIALVGVALLAPGLYEKRQAESDGRRAAE